MATFTKRKERWTAQVRRKGYAPRSRTFTSKAEAKAWATLEEARIERGEELPDHATLRSATLSELIKRYMREVSPYKRGRESEQLRLGKMHRDKIGKLSLARLTAHEVAEYRDRRLRVAQPSTVHRELSLLAHVLDVAHNEWGIRQPKNIAREVRKPRPNPARERRLEPGEYERIERATNSSRNPEVRLAIDLAIQTGLRRGELLSLEWQNIDLDVGTAHIPVTKTGASRTIPLTKMAIQLLKGQRQDRTDERVFSISGNALRLGWVRVLKRAKIVDLRFHDLRHEAISRFFELGLSLPEVALISGHQDPRMLLRYTQLRPSDLACKLMHLTR